MRLMSSSLLIATLVLAGSPSRAEYDPVTMDPPDRPGPAAILWEGHFMSEGNRLNAIAYEARGPGPHPTALLLHGFPGNEKNLDLAQAMRRAGWNVVFFHYRGAWGSGGRFSFSGALADVISVAKAVAAPGWAREHRVDSARIVVVGHSMGGFLALAAASTTPSITCAVSMAGPNLGAMAPADLDGAASLETGRRLEGWAEGRLRGATGPALMADLSVHRSQLDLVRLAPGLDQKPVLLIAGRSDPVVPWKQIQSLAETYRAAGNPHASWEIMEGDHSFSEQRIELAHRVIGFLDAHCR